MTLDQEPRGARAADRSREKLPIVVRGLTGLELVDALGHALSWPEIIDPLLARRSLAHDLAC